VGAGKNVDPKRMNRNPERKKGVGGGDKG
jgi:hypothetical protein